MHKTCRHLSCMHKIRQTPLSHIHKIQHDAFQAGEGTIFPLSCKIQDDGCAQKTPTTMPSSIDWILSGPLTWYDWPVVNSPVNDCTSIFFHLPESWQMILAMLNIWHLIHSTALTTELVPRFLLLFCLLSLCLQYQSCAHCFMEISRLVLCLVSPTTRTHWPDSIDSMTSNQCHYTSTLLLIAFRRTNRILPRECVVACNP